jgi:hypothetical protein
MSRNCFVVMPFAPAFTPLWTDVIRPAIASAGHSVVRADDLFRSGTIISSVCDLIRAADYIVADLTGRNANVFYELGFAHAIGKPAVLLTQHLHDVPVDLLGQRVFEYTDSIGGGTRLRAALAQAVAQM